VFSSLIHSVAIIAVLMKPHAHRKKNNKKCPLRGLGWVPIFVYPKSYFFCDLKLHAKFHNNSTTPSGRKVCGTERKRKKKNKLGLSCAKLRLNC
jgi:hypothetical protein